MGSCAAVHGQHVLNVAWSFEGSRPLTHKRYIADWRVAGCSAPHDEAVVRDLGAAHPNFASAACTCGPSSRDQSSRLTHCLPARTSCTAFGSGASASHRGSVVLSYGT